MIRRPGLPGEELLLPGPLSSGRPFLPADVDLCCILGRVSAAENGMVVCFYFQFTNAHEKTVLKSLGIENNRGARGATRETRTGMMIICTITRAPLGQRRQPCHTGLDVEKR